MRLISFFLAALILAGCKSKSTLKSDTKQIDEVATKPIYLGPIEYDTLIQSVREKLEYKKDYVGGHIPSDQEISMTFRYFGKFKKYMQHGTMHVIPWDSSVIVTKLSDSTFTFRVRKPLERGVVSMDFNPVLKAPYYFIWKRKEQIDTIPPGDLIPLFRRSYMTKL
ncbi:MAG: hypothetical protein HWE22_10585 [Flavobacteriales bacterium]|nr:hypothetical protein [Flavobacteriales bacterium]